MFKKIVLLLLTALICVGSAAPSFAQDIVRYEYKIVKLGSLTALQKKDDPQAQMAAIEGLLNEQGREGWEMVNLFAIRTTFDPNVFFVAMKRPLVSAAEKSPK